MSRFGRSGHLRRNLIEQWLKDVVVASIYQRHIGITATQ